MWNEVNRMQLREEFVHLARQDGANVSELCRRYGISRPTGYKWLARARSDDAAAWSQDRSRRPRNSPNRCQSEMEEAVIAVRRDHPAWGGRKIRWRLMGEGWTHVPAASTITAILQRHGLIEDEESRKRGPMRRFERQAPNELWQMDFKGRVPIAVAGFCHPLTVVDDHSRYALAVTACVDERERTVRHALRDAMRRYGLPQRMLMDNGACWGKVVSAWTCLEVWLLRLGVSVSHGRPYHPQTQGKCERFNRTLDAEALRGRQFHDLQACQRRFDRFRHDYNHLRPHEALAMAAPVSRYRVSAVAFPETLAPIEYLAGDVVRRVGPAGYISLRKQRYQIGRAFTGEPVALRPTVIDGEWTVHYCHQRIATINERTGHCRQEPHPRFGPRIRPSIEENLLLKGIEEV